MSGSPSCPVDPVIATETSFYNWVKSGNYDSRTCPTSSQVYDALQVGNSNGSTAVSYSNQQVKDLNKRLQQRQLDVQVAKDRAKMVARPEMTASYYDGWFPLNRPLKNMSVPILICVSSLLFVFAFLMFLDLMGIKASFSVFTSYISIDKFSKPFWIMAVIAVMFFALTLYAFLR